MFALLMGLKTVSPAELQQLQSAGRVTTFDVNSRQRWREARVPGAVNITPDYREQELPADRSSTLVFYCSNVLCRKAPNAARRAKGLGYSDVRVMSAGIAGWLAAQLPTASGE